MDKSRSFLKSLNLDRDRYIIVGCSGGPDSMCLLDMLVKMDYKVVCAHVDHSIREESEDEYKFLRNYCEKRKVIFEGLKLPKMESAGESLYRQKRYEFYKNLATKYETPYIMTAHHGDDLIETILMRITRGSHLKGYLGFKKVYKEKEFIFVKPLIFYTKEDILKYINEFSIPYVHDKTNDEDKYTRNRYRHNILPFLKREREDIHLKYLQYSEELAEAWNYIDHVVCEKIKDNYDGHTIDLAKFEQVDPYIQKKELEQILGTIYKDDVDKLRVFHIEAILKNIQKHKNFQLDLPLGFQASREYDKLSFEKKTNFEPYKFELKKVNILPNGDTIKIEPNSEDTSNYTTRLNTEDLELPLYIRTKLPEDKMEIKNMKGSKKVKNIFIDCKLKPSKRKAYPIVTDSKGNILWLPGIRKSKFDVNKDGKYDIILKYTKREENFDEKK